MGIKDLRTFLKNKKVDCFCTIPLLEFYGKRVAIDSLNWVFCYMGNCVKSIMSTKGDPMKPISQEELYRKMVQEFLNFNIKLMNHGITPLWIWDGVSKDNKTVTKVERRNARKAMIEKRDNVFNVLQKLNPLERPSELLKEFQQLTMNTTCLKREKIDDLKELSLEIGIPTITADDEAEALAASLAVERIVAAVWTADTDTYPIGCPIVIKGFENVKGEVHINAVFTLKILKELKLNHDEFRDFCIMLGTDFNDRLDRIGPVKSFKLIEKYRCLEEVEKHTQHNLYALKYKEVRPQLASYKTIYNGVDDLFCNTMVNFGELKSKYSRYYNLGDFFNYMINLSKPQNIPKPK